MKPLPIGQIITDEQPRDAIHIAVAPVVAAEKLFTGQHIGMTPEGTATTHVFNPIGIVDPFLRVPVEQGMRFWMFLYPGSVTSLLHVWSHPAFEKHAPRSPQQLESEKWLRAFADEWGMDYEEMIRRTTAGEGITAFGRSISGWSELGEDAGRFWSHLQILTGKMFSAEHRENTYFSCTC